MPNVESFWRGELRSAVSSTQTVPFTLSVSVVPNNTEMYFTVDGDTDDEEIFYFTTKSGTAGGPGTLNVTGRGYNKHNSSQSSANQRAHGINSPYNGAINHIVVNQKAGLNEENIFTEVVIPPTFADDAAADASYTGGVAPNGALFYSTAAGAVRVKQGGVWANGTGAADFAATRNVASASASNGELFRDSGSSNDLSYKDHGGTVRNLVVASTGKFDTNRYDFASQAEAESGTEATKPLNSLRVSEAVAYQAQRQQSIFTLQTDPLGTKGISASATTLRTTTSTTAVKVKEVTAKYTGTYQISFDLSVNSGSNTASAQIYKNGVAFGTLRSASFTAGTYTTYTENLVFTAGDLIQLYYFAGNASNGAATRNFYVYGFYFPTVLVSTVGLD